jgi:Raf kinase inhibitor-like YbhB/YbcL family protein
MSAMMTLNSPAFQDYGPIPSRYTCDGANISPPLAWSNVPANAQSLVLIVEDEDATDRNFVPLPAPWVHWVLYNIPPIESLPEGGPLPAGTLEGVNGSGETGYVGPCPPRGRHRYFHRLLALNQKLPDRNRPSKDALLSYLRFQTTKDPYMIIARVNLVGTYQMPIGTCTSGGTTTSIPTSAFSHGGSDIVADQFVGRTLTFDENTATAALQRQATNITANTAGSTPTFTVGALTTAPSSGDTFGVGRPE